MKKFYIRL